MVNVNCKFNSLGGINSEKWIDAAVLKEYAYVNHDTLSHVMLDDDIKGVIVYIHQGWATLVTENGNIIQAWAGELRSIN